MRRLFIGLLVVGGCQFDTAVPATPLSGDSDAAVSAAADAAPGADGSAAVPDAAPTPPDASPMFDCDEWERQPESFDPCSDIDIVTDNLFLDDTGEYTYDTDTGVLTSPGATEIPNTSIVLGAGAEAPRVLVAGAMTLGGDASLRATGSRPLMIVSWFSFSIEGTIDVGSDVELGAGANSSACPTAEPGQDDTDGGAGGGGGALGGSGGQGADARNGGDGLGGAGATALVAPTFHGGCPGGDGGDGQSNLGGNGGAGGGAIHLVARQALVVSGTITSGGAGGGGSQGDRSGGAGGGSGGMIILESASVDLLSGAVVAANGGGGGGGTNQDVALSGQPGQPGDVAATGGDGEGAAPAADGGAGGVLGAIDGLPGFTSGRGGGGGGGGVGVIRILANQESTSNAIVSPPADS